MPIDLRSDTVTKPTPAMRAAMAEAEVGDDVFGEDPTVNQLEERTARMLGHEAALFCASGTMANQIAINVHTRPGDEVICDEGAHIYRYEGGGTMANSGCSVRLLQGDRGRYTAAQVKDAIADAANPYFARTRLVCVEDTSNRGGGSVWDRAEILKIREVCREHGLALHLDGARIFNALAVTGESPSDRGSLFDSLSVCLSKGLGAPVGSMLIGNRAFIAQARRVRKRWGGGMRQAGIIAAAGLFALEHHVQRLRTDHLHAKLLAEGLATAPSIATLLPVQTNILVFNLISGLSAKEMVHKLRGLGILAAEFGPKTVRMVTHLDIDDKAIEQVLATMRSIAK